MNLRDAVQAPRIHFEAGELQLEAGIKPTTLGWLRRWGYDIVRWPDMHMFFGGAHAVGKDDGGHFQGAGDPRRCGRGKVAGGCSWFASRSVAKPESHIRSGV
ncbi:MAG: hypothetical protein GY762_22135 [Proteobacteria bacterium]|nr:hypothetical protein [Pseudomonadota bacterium]